MTKTQYVDTELFEKKLAESGMKKGFLCETMGISRQAFAKKRAGETPFKMSEIFVLCTLLRIPDEDRGKFFFD